MKRLLSLLAVLMICALCVIPITAATADAGISGGTVLTRADAALTAADGAKPAEIGGDGIVKEEDMRIDLNLTTTLIIVCCAAVTIFLIIVTVILGRRNHS